MKSNRGITLTSLAIYIIGLMIMITLMATFESYFVKNVNEVVMDSNTQGQYSKFLAYITKDINSNDLEFVKVDEANGLYLIMLYKNNIQHQYIYDNDSIFYVRLENNEVTNKIILCKNVYVTLSPIFSYKKDESKISYNFSIDDDEFSGEFNIK